MIYSGRALVFSKTQALRKLFIISVEEQPVELIGYFILMKFCEWRNSFQVLFKDLLISNSFIDDPRAGVVQIGALGAPSQRGRLAVFAFSPLAPHHAVMGMDTPWRRRHPDCPRHEAQRPSVKLWLLFRAASLWMFLFLHHISHSIIRNLNRDNLQFFLGNAQTGLIVSFSTHYPH